MSPVIDRLTRSLFQVPRIDSLVPLQSAEFIRTEMAEGRLSQEEAMDHLLLLLAPRDAWMLYKDSTDAVRNPTNAIMPSNPFHCARSVMWP